MLQARGLPDQRVGDAVRSAELRVNARIGTRLERVPHQPVRIGRQPDFRALDVGRPQAQFRDQRQRELGHALGHAAARVLLEHHVVHLPVVAQAPRHRLGVERAAPVPVRETVVTAEEVDRPGNASAGHLRALHAGLRHPSLNDAHAERPIDVALEAAATAVEGQGQRVQRLLGREPQDARRSGGGGEHDDDAGRVEPVVLRLAQVEARAELCTGNQGGHELGAGAATRQFCRRQSGRDQGRADVRAWRHRVAEVERAAHRGVELGGGRGGQPVAVDEGGCLGGSARFAQEFPKCEHTVLGGAGETGSGDGQDHAAQDALGLERHRINLQAGHEIGEFLFKLSHRSPSLADRRRGRG